VLVLGCSFLGTKASFTYTDLFRCLASVRFTRSSTVCKSFALLFGFPYVARRASQLAMK